MYSVSCKYPMHSCTAQLTFTQLIRNARERDKEALAVLYQHAFGGRGEGLATPTQGLGDPHLVIQPSPRGLGDGHKFYF